MDPATQCVVMEVAERAPGSRPLIWGSLWTIVRAVNASSRPSINQGTIGPMRRQCPRDREVDPWPKMINNKNKRGIPCSIRSMSHESARHPRVHSLREDNSHHKWCLLNSSNRMVKTPSQHPCGRPQSWTSSIWISRGLWTILVCSANKTWSSIMARRKIGRGSQICTHLKIPHEDISHHNRTKATHPRGDQDHQLARAKLLKVHFTKPRIDSVLSLKLRKERCRNQVAHDPGNVTTAEVDDRSQEQAIIVIQMHSLGGCSKRIWIRKTKWEGQAPPEAH